MEAAKALGLSAAPDALPTRRAEPEIHEIIREVEVEVPAPLADAVIVDRPLRSGQRVYAKGTDIVVLDMVSYGAEVIADGNVHVYAPLRGRAVAGASGNTSARIFSTCMRNCFPSQVSTAQLNRSPQGRRRQSCQGAPGGRKNRYRAGMRDTPDTLSTCPICLKGIVQTWPKSSS